MQDPRIDKLARLLVQYSVAVKKDDVVRINGPTLALPLIRAVYREVLLAGGQPMLRISDDEVADLFYEHASDKQLSYLSPLAVREVESIDCSIGIWANDNTKSMSQVEPRKQALVSKARRPVMDLFLQRAARRDRHKLRWTGTQYPCNSAAQDAEMSLAQYERFVYSAGMLHLKDPLTHWKKLSVAQKRLCDELNRGSEMHLKTPQGTDIRLGIKRRTWINCDGHENFPDGEVFTSPIEDATEGVVVYSFPAVHGGREVQDIRLKFKAGVVVEASASKGEDFLLQMLAMDRGAKVLGELALGTNYAVTDYTRNTLFDEKIGGTFHLALGMAYPESGGKNTSGLHWDMVCDLRSGGTVTVDGKLISKNGRFVRAAWPQPLKRKG